MQLTYPKMQLTPMEMQLTEILLILLSRYDNINWVNQCLSKNYSKRQNLLSFTINPYIITERENF